MGRDGHINPDNSEASGIAVTKVTTHEVEPLKLAWSPGPGQRCVPWGDDDYSSPRRERDAARKHCEELENWKVKQQEIYKAELDQKTDLHLKKIIEEWSKLEYTVDKDFKKKETESNELRAKLEYALNELSNQTESLNKREFEVIKLKAQINDKYLTKIEKLKKASEIHQYNMEHTLRQVENEKNISEYNIRDMEAEVIKLKEKLKQCEDSANILAEINSVKLQLDKTRETKAFFKQLWGKNVRELCKIKGQEKSIFKEKIQQDLNEIGLVQQITQEVQEMKKDQMALKEIKEKLQLQNIE